MQRIILSLFLIIIYSFPAKADLAQYTCVRNFYIATNGLDAPGRGSQALPWKTITYANNNGGLVAGDCVNLAPGTYNNPGGLYLNRGGNANLPTGYITWKGAPNHTSKITGTSSLFLLSFQANYIYLDGFEIDATGIPDYAVAVPNWPVASAGHHIGIINNLIHDSVGGGIGIINYDYYDVIGNEIHHTSNNSAYALYESGISVWNLKAKAPNPAHPLDANPFHTRILKNKVYLNWNNHPWSQANPHTDGNGIIIDATDGSQDNLVDYGQQTLVQSNLVFNNGGRGIHAFYSHKVTVANNTTYGNAWDPGFTGTSRGELSNVCANNNTWVNNLAIAVPGTGDLANNKSVVDATYFIGGCTNTNIVWQNNITWRGIVGDPSANFNDIQNGSTKLAAFISNNIEATNPLLTDPVNGNFVPLANSPAIGAGISTPSYPPSDFYGVLMPNPPHVGAFSPLGLTGSHLLKTDGFFILMTDNNSKILLNN